MKERVKTMFRKMKNSFTGSSRKFKIALIATGILIVLGISAVTLFPNLFTKASAIAINFIDGQEPVNGNIPNPIFETPTFQGTANEGDLVSVYDRTVGDTPSINQVAGEDDLSITYQPAEPSPGGFTDNFDDDNWQDKWRNNTQAQEPSESDGVLHLYPWGGVSSSTVFSIQNQSFIIEADVKIPIQYDTNNPEAAIGLGIVEQQVDGCGEGGCSPGSHLGIRGSDTGNGPNIVLT